MNRRAGDELADVMTRKDSVLGNLRELALRLPLQELPTFLGRLETARWNAVFRSLPVPQPELKSGREPLLTIEEVRRFLGISKATIYRLSRTDLRSTVVDVGPGTIRFDPVGLDRFVRARRRP